MMTGKRLLFLKYLLGSDRNILQEPRGSYRNIVLKKLLNVSVQKEPPWLRRESYRKGVLTYVSFCGTISGALAGNFW